MRLSVAGDTNMGSGAWGGRLRGELTEFIGRRAELALVRQALGAARLLTGVGMAAGPAFSVVLLYRLATYWLPVAPGWLSWRVLQRREYV